MLRRNTFGPRPLLRGPSASTGVRHHRAALPWQRSTGRPRRHPRQPGCQGAPAVFCRQNPACRSRGRFRAFRRVSAHTRDSLLPGQIRKPDTKLGSGHPENCWDCHAWTATGNVIWGLFRCVSGKILAAGEPDSGVDLVPSGRSGALQQKVLRERVGWRRPA